MIKQGKVETMNGLKRTTALLSLGAVLSVIPGVRARAAAIELGSIDVSLQSPGDVIRVGDGVDVSVFGSPSDVLVGFGFDLVFDNPSVLAYEGFDAGAGFIGVPTPDGDNIAGLSFSGGVQGADQLLGVAHFTALQPGSVTVALQTTPNDLTEGFARSGEGFFGIGSLGALPLSVASAAGGGGGTGSSEGGQQIPEPATAVLLSMGILAMLRRRVRQGA